MKGERGFEVIGIICFTSRDRWRHPAWSFPAFARKLTVRVTKESRKQTTKGLWLIRMYEGN